uniref:Uncharacterized protein n=1 Tax=Timema tahoe TaxID=61484 RepID=A0A7R9FMU4_9NEOP|nr:unnamed protein product [Timema tahoe]
MLNPSLRTYRITSAIEVLLDKKQLSSMQAEVVKRNYLDFVSKQEVIDYLKQFTSNGDQLDNEPDLEDFLSNLYSQPGSGSGEGATEQARTRKKSKRKK